MARTFDGSTSNKLTRSDVLGLTDYPFSVAAWARPVNVTANHGILNFGDASSNTQYAYFWLGGGVGGDPLRVGTIAPSYGVDSSNGFTANEWNSCVGVWQVGEKTAFLNGTKTTSIHTATTWISATDRTGVGVLERATPAIPMDGDLAWVCVWDVALSDDEAFAYNSGAHPLSIRPGSIIAFWPLTGESVDGEADVIGAYPLTETGNVTTAESPLVSLGWPMAVTRSAAAAPSTDYPFWAVRNTVTIQPGGVGL